MTREQCSSTRGDGSASRRKRLLFRCRHRGTQENDLLLGSFAETYLATFDGAQLERLEALLECSDPDLFNWVVGRRAPPPQYDHDVMHLLRSFRFAEHRDASPNTGDRGNVGQQSDSIATASQEGE